MPRILPVVVGNSIQGSGKQKRKVEVVRWGTYINPKVVLVSAFLLRGCCFRTLQVIAGLMRVCMGTGVGRHRRACHQRGNTSRAGMSKVVRRAQVFPISRCSPWSTPPNNRITMDDDGRHLRESLAMHEGGNFSHAAMAYDW